MSGLVLWSDSHFDNRKAFAHPLQNPEFSGCNSRFHVIANSFRKAVEYAVKNDCEAIIVPGDVFHTRMIIDIPIYNAVNKLLSEAATKIKVILTIGNHDYVDMNALKKEEELHSLYSFRTICDVVSEPRNIQLDDFTLTLLPFSPDVKNTIAASTVLLKSSKIYNKPTILFLHHSFNGASTGPHEWIMPHRLIVDDLPNYDLMFSGHYHKHQTIYSGDRKKKMTYIGSPVQHDLGERTYIPGFIHVKADGAWEHIEDSESPRFVVIEAHSKKDLIGLLPEDYKVIKWQGDEKEGLDLREDAPNTIVEITPKSVKTQVRSSINTVDSVEDMMNKYLVTKLGQENKAYLETGLELYKGK